MKRFATTLVVCVMVFFPLAHAETSEDPLAWLSRIASAAQRLDYSGTFIYQSGRNIETSRITHVVDADGEHERLEVLDGSPREVIRKNEEVWCVFPDQKTVITDRSGGLRSFPARLPESFSGVTENYEIRIGEVGRVAGFDARQIVLEPRDDLRYGHILWADVVSGLLLKSRMVDRTGEVIEQFTFSDVTIGGVIDPERLKPHFRKDDSWRVVSAHGDEVGTDSSGWVARLPPAGYTLQSVVRRPLGRDRRDVMHLVFNDGLAAISVFVEPMDDGAASDGLGPLATGAINIYRRVVDGHLITVLGEVPLQAVQLLGDTMEPSRK